MQATFKSTNWDGIEFDIECTLKEGYTFMTGKYLPFGKIILDCRYENIGEIESDFEGFCKEQLAAKGFEAIAC